VEAVEAADMAEADIVGVVEVAVEVVSLFLPFTPCSIADGTNKVVGK
jgi:hypothetical protein